MWRTPVYTCVVPVPQYHLFEFEEGPFDELMIFGTCTRPRKLLLASSEWNVSCTSQSTVPYIHTYIHVTCMHVIICMCIPGTNIKSICFFQNSRFPNWKLVDTGLTTLSNLNRAKDKRRRVAADVWWNVSMIELNMSGSLLPNTIKTLNPLIRAFHCTSAEWIYRSIDLPRSS